MENKTDKTNVTNETDAWVDLKTPLEATIVAAERQLAWDRERVKRSEATLRPLYRQQLQRRRAQRERTN